MGNYTDGDGRVYTVSGEDELRRFEADDRFSAVQEPEEAPKEPEEAPKEPEEAPKEPEDLIGGALPDQTWKNADIETWLEQAGKEFVKGSTKADLLLAAAGE